MMKVQINITMTEMVAKRYADDKREFTIEIEEGSAVDNLIKELGIPDDERYFIMYTVNGKFCKKDKILKNGDDIKILPVIGGG